MAQLFSMKPIAHIRSDFSTKFGVPRQSGLVDALESTVVFEPEYRNPDALRGLEDFSHLWLVWVFDQAIRSEWSPTGATLEVIIPPELLARVPAGRQEALRGVLAQDPRPHYQNDPDRVYGFGFAGLEVRFTVDGTVLTVRDIQ